MTLFSRLLGKKPEALSLEKFAERFVQAMRRKGLQEVRLDLGPSAAESKIAFRVQGGPVQYRFLGNIYDQHRQTPDELRRLIDHHVASMIAIPLKTGARREKILPSIKTQGYLVTSAAQTAQLNLDLRGFSEPFIVDPLAGDLVIIYVEDTETQTISIPSNGLGDYGVERSDLYALAMANLSWMSGAMTIQGGGGRYLVKLDGCYDASLILLFDQWRHRLSLQGDPVIAVPSRDNLIVCDAINPADINTLRDLAAQIAPGAYGLSSQLYTWREGKLALFDQ